MARRTKSKSLRRITVTVASGDCAKLNQLVDRNEERAPWVIRRSVHEFRYRHRDEYQTQVMSSPGIL